MKLREQFMLLVGIPLSALLLITLTGWYQLNHVAQESESVAQRLSNRTMLSDGDRDAYQAYVALRASTTAHTNEQFNAAKRDFTENAGQVKARVKEALNLDDDHIAALSKEMASYFGPWKANGDKIMALGQTILKDDQDRRAAAGNAIESFGPMRDVLNSMGENATGEALSLILNADRDAYQAYVAQIQAIDVHTREEFDALAEENETNMQQVQDRIGKAIVLLGTDSVTVNQFADLYNSWLAQNRTFFELTDGMVDALQQRNIALAQTDVLFERMRSHIDKSGEQLTTEATEYQAETARETQTTIVLFLVVGIVFLLASIWYASMKVKTFTSALSSMTNHMNNFARGDIRFIQGQEKYVRQELAVRKDELGSMGRAFTTFINYIEKQVSAISQIADGDLRVSVTAASENDTLGHSISRMIHELNQLIRTVQSMSESVNTGAAQLNEASTSLSQGSTEQAASLEEVNSSVSLITEQMREGAERSGEATKTSAAAASLADKSRTAMSDMQESMSRINQNAEQTRRVIKVIDDIAFQTNLLALNAAVEAARAGRHGKGFAVVAEEVRSLASRSAAAARETAELIDSSNAETTDGAQLLENTANVLMEVTERVNEINGSMDEINRGTQENFTGLNEISTALNQVDIVTQQNSAHSEETAAAAQEMHGQARQLSGAVSRFTVDR